MGRSILLSWSSGKDSAWALHRLQKDPAVEVVGLLTTLTETHERVAMHGVRRRLLEIQAESAGLPLRPVLLPDPCSNAVYEERMGRAVEQARADGIEAVAFGDLFLEDIRTYRERMLEGTGLEPLFPLWGEPTDSLARAMIAAGQRAVLTCVDVRRCPATLLGRTFDGDLLDDLPQDVDPCAENGEFHTFATEGPAFRHAIPVRTGERVERAPFHFIDLLPA